MAEQEDYNVVIPDVRFQNEVDAVRMLGGKIIRINRESVRPKVISHPSENIDILTGVDIVVDNNGTIEDLWSNADIVLNYIESVRN
jgi:hypothetical protein